MPAGRAPIYYVGLSLIIRWPPSLLAQDLLFLIPIPWIAQVWFPVLVSLLAVAASPSRPTKPFGALAHPVALLTLLPPQSRGTGSTTTEPNGEGTICQGDLIRQKRTHPNL